jgi:hypothetical protein
MPSATAMQFTRTSAPGATVGGLNSIRLFTVGAVDCWHIEKGWIVLGSYSELH